jgi:hypothetical protein
MSDYLQVRKWADFQHYRDRQPTWIKLYRKLLTDYEFQRLTDAERGQLVMIWLLAAELDNKIPNDPAWVRARIGSRRAVPLSRFVAAGFLQEWRSADAFPANRNNGASESGAKWYKDASLETETERERALRQEENLRRIAALRAQLSGEQGENVTNISERKSA